MDHIPCDSPLILEKAASRTAGFLGRYRAALLSALISGFLAYGFVITNKLINHDEAHSLFSKGGTVTSGRWGLGALDAIFPNYSMPWLYGLITIFLVAAAVCLMADLFGIRNRLLQGLLAGTVMVFPSLIGLMGYMFTSCSFGLAFFLAVLSVYLLCAGNKWYIPAAGALLVLSLSIYQSYISLAASLLVLVLICRLLTGSEAAAVLKQGIFYVFFLVAALLVYYLATQVVLKLTGTELGGYASGNFTFSPSAVLSGAVMAYRNFFRFFTEGFNGLIPTAFSRLLHLSLLAMVPVLLLLLKSRTRNTGSLLLLMLLILVLPLAMNCMYMITSEESIHTLVLYSFAVFYVLILALAQLALDSARKVPVNAVTLLLALVITVNIGIANQAYLHLHLRYENAYAFYTALAADIKMQPEFTENTKLAVVGNYQQPEFYTEQFEHIHTITGVYGFVPDNYSNESFLTYYVGFPIPFASPEEISAIRETAEFAEMPVYPYYGSLRSFGDILVVKLS